MSQILNVNTAQYNELLALKLQSESLSKQLKRVDELLKQKTAMITDQISGKEAVIGDMKFLNVERAGTVDYKQAQRDGIDLSDYQRPPSRYWKLSVLEGADISSFFEVAAE
jgi:hypothetical protein